MPKDILIIHLVLSESVEKLIKKLFLLTEISTGA